MTGTTVDNLSAVQSLKNNLVLKTTNFSIFRAPASAAAITRAILFDATTGKLLSDGLTAYKEFGLTSDDGAKFARALTVEDIPALQSSTPVRSDITADDTTMQFESIETNLTTLCASIGVDPTTVTTTPDAGGSVSIDQPKVSAGTGYRYLAIAYDTARDIYVARHFPNGVVDAIGDQAFQKAGALGWSLTVKALFDSAEGTAVRWLFGGAGWLTALTDMGFTAGGGV